MIKEYLRGIWIIIGVIIIAFLLAVFFSIFESIYLAVLIILAVVAIIIIPYYLGKKEKQKPGKYKLRKVKKI